MSPASTQKESRVKTVRQKRAVRVSTASATAASKKNAAERIDSDEESNRPVRDPKKRQSNAIEALKQRRKRLSEKKTTGATIMKADSCGRTRRTGTTRKRRLSFTDHSAAQKKEEVIKTPTKITSLSELFPASITRSKMASILYAPFFVSTITGAFVRLAGNRTYGEHYQYFIWKVIGVEEADPVYTFDGKQTMKRLNCQYGSEVRLIELNFVSDAEIEPLEFANFMRVSKTADTVPFAEDLDKKKNEIRQALHHRYTEEDISFMIAEKKKFQKEPHNYAMHKAHLLKQKELASQSGNASEAMRLQEEIDQVDLASKNREMERSNTSAMAALVNQRRAERMMVNLQMQKNQDKRGKGLRMKTMNLSAFGWTGAGPETTATTAAANGRFDGHVIECDDPMEVDDDQMEVDYVSGGWI